MASERAVTSTNTTSDEPHENGSSINKSTETNPKNNGSAALKKSLIQIAKVDKRRNAVLQQVTIHPDAAFLSGSSNEECASLVIPLNEYETFVKRRMANTRSEKDIVSSITEANEDLSLGMKLTIVSGLVIVQSLNCLKNGMASPAQLSGKICRGDVLVRINDVSLKDKNGLEVMQALKVLGSKVEEAEGESLITEFTLRFAIGEGLDLLDKTKKKSIARNEKDNDEEPIFSDSLLSARPTPLLENNVAGVQLQSQGSGINLNLLQAIATKVAEDRAAESWMSQFYQLDPSCSELLRKEDDKFEVVEISSDRITLGNQAIEGAKSVYDQTETKESHSVYDWYLQESMNVISASASALMEDSYHGDGERGVDFDDGLVYNVIKQRILYQLHQLEKPKENPTTLNRLWSSMDESTSSKNMHNGKSNHSNKAVSSNNAFDTFFQAGQEQTAIRQGFPDSEVTESLYTLALSRNFEMSTLFKSSRSKADLYYFLIQEALPLWLTCFIPLHQKCRKYIWSHEHHDLMAQRPGDQYPPKQQLDDMSIISLGSLSLSGISEKRKLMEMIKEGEISLDAKVQTCYLITFYLTHNMYTSKSTESEILEFIKSYGAYLDLHPCLVSASSYGGISVVEGLLEVAKHDPHHKQCMRSVVEKKHDMVYKPEMISAMLEHLRSKSKAIHENLRIIVLAYPDLKPWLVKHYCTETAVESKPFSESYYKYLSRLLNPRDGQEEARRDSALVSELCKLSIDCNDNNIFYDVAEDKGHTTYRRDLHYLLELAMEVVDDKLAMDIAEEMLVDVSIAKDGKLLSSILHMLREVGKRIARYEELDDAMKHAMRVLYKLRCAYNSEDVDIPKELLFVLKAIRSHGDSSDVLNSNEEVFVVANYANPVDVLTTFRHLIDSNESYSQLLMPEVPQLLKRAAFLSVRMKKYGGLMFLRNEQKSRFQELFSDESFKIGKRSFSTYGNRSIHKVEKKCWDKVIDMDCIINK